MNTDTVFSLFYYNVREETNEHLSYKHDVP